MNAATGLTLPAATRTATVRIEGVRLSLGSRRVLDAISLVLSEKRIGIVGRNGSGKTSLARVICGLVKPETGRVLVNDVDVYKDRRGALAEIGIIFQNPDHQIIFPTVEEEVTFGPRQQGYSKEQARRIALAALQRFGASDWADRPVAELSQGQRHLVCLIAVLAMRPSVVVLDEPFTGLDYPTTHRLRRHLAAIPQTVIQITHDTTSLAEFDRVIWLADGVVEKDGPARRVLAAYGAEMERLGGDHVGSDLAD